MYRRFPVLMSSSNWAVKVNNSQRVYVCVYAHGQRLSSLKVDNSENVRLMFMALRRQSQTGGTVHPCSITTRNIDNVIWRMERGLADTQSRRVADVTFLLDYSARHKCALEWMSAFIYRTSLRFCHLLTQPCTANWQGMYYISV